MNPIQHKPGDIFVDDDGNEHRCVEDIITDEHTCDECSANELCHWAYGDIKFNCERKTHSEGINVHYERVEEE